MVEKAEAGDVAAAKLILQYTVGKPAEAVEPDRVEIDEHRLRTESTLTIEDWGPRVGDLPARTVNTFWNAVAPQMESEALMPMLLGGLEVKAASPERKAKVERRAARRTIRMLQEGIPASANGSIGRKDQDASPQARRTGQGPGEAVARRLKTTNEEREGRYEAVFQRRSALGVRSRSSGLKGRLCQRRAQPWNPAAKNVAALKGTLTLKHEVEPPIQGGLARCERIPGMRLRLQSRPFRPENDSRPIERLARSPQTSVSCPPLPFSQKTFPASTRLRYVGLTW